MSGTAFRKSPVTAGNVIFPSNCEEASIVEQKMEENEKKWQRSGVRTLTTSEVRFLNLTFLLRAKEGQVGLWFWTAPSGGCLWKGVLPCT
jgi:uncharacterized protein (DUF1697 family)